MGRRMQFSGVRRRPVIPLAVRRMAQRRREEQRVRELPEPAPQKHGLP